MSARHLLQQLAPPLPEGGRIRPFVPRGFANNIRFQSFGQALKFFREERGFTHSDVARKVGASTEAVQLWELGDGAPQRVVRQRLYGLFRPLRGLDYMLRAVAGEIAAKAEAKGIALPAAKATEEAATLVAISAVERLASAKNPTTAIDDEDIPVTPELRKQFGERLRAVRKARGWSAYKVAEAARVSERTVRFWEDGTNYPSDDKFMLRLARAFPQLERFPLPSKVPDDMKVEPPEEKPAAKPAEAAKPGEKKSEEKPAALPLDQWARAFRSAMAGAKMSAADVADKLGVDPATVRRWEREENAPVTDAYERLRKLFPAIAAIPPPEGIRVPQNPFARALRDARIAEGLTVNQLAGLLGCSPAAIGLWETNRPPSLGAYNQLQSLFPSLASAPKPEGMQEIIAPRWAPPTAPSAPPAPVVEPLPPPPTPAATEWQATAATMVVPVEAPPPPPPVQVAAPPPPAPPPSIEPVEEMEDVALELADATATVKKLRAQLAEAIARQKTAMAKLQAMVTE